MIHLIGVFWVSFRRSRVNINFVMSKPLQCLESIATFLGPSVQIRWLTLPSFLLFVHITIISSTLTRRIATFSSFLFLQSMYDHYCLDGIYVSLYSQVFHAKPWKIVLVHTKPFLTSIIFRYLGGIDKQTSFSKSH